jgi:hypothetical protein
VSCRVCARDSQQLIQAIGDGNKVCIAGREVMRVK